jgi:hypothetical protein
MKTDGNHDHRTRRLSSIKLGPVEDLQSQLRGALQRMSLSSVVSSTSIPSHYSVVFHLHLCVRSSSTSDRGGQAAAQIQQAFSPDRAALINDAMKASENSPEIPGGQDLHQHITAGGLIILSASEWTFPSPGPFSPFAELHPHPGHLIATAMPTLVAVIQFADWIMPLWVLITLAVVLTVMGNFIEPRILGESVNLSPLAALFALIFWGWMWGAAGMVIAVPLTAMIKFTLDHIDGLRPLGVMMGGED